ncbi:MAG: hypothetical protein AAF562_00995 [Pseudomonadota bacterium]
MSDSYLPQIFEGFPELSDKAKALEAALHSLAGAAVEAKQKMDTGPAATDSGAATDEMAALKEEVAHWKAQYDALASRFDSEIEAAKGAANPTEATPNQDAYIAELEDTKARSAEEIARLAESVAQARGDAEKSASDATNALAQLELANSELSALKQQSVSVELPAESGDSGESDDVAALKMALDEKENALKAALDRVAASEEARAAAASRVAALMESLGAGRTAGAA